MRPRNVCMPVEAGMHPPSSTAGSVPRGFKLLSFGSHSACVVRVCEVFADASRIEVDLSYHYAAVS